MTYGKSKYVDTDPTVSQRYACVIVLWGLALIGLVFVGGQALAQSNGGDVFHVTRNTGISIALVQLILSAAIAIAVSLAGVKFHIRNLEIHTSKSEMLETFTTKTELEKTRKDYWEQLPDKIELAVLRALDKYNNNNE